MRSPSVSFSVHWIYHSENSFFSGFRPCKCNLANYARILARIKYIYFDRFDVFVQVWLLLIYQEYVESRLRIQSTEWTVFYLPRFFLSGILVV